MSMVNQVNALAERVGQEFQRQAKTCSACPWHWAEEVQRTQRIFWDNAVVGAYFFNPPALMAATPLICLAAWSAYWRGDRA